MQYRTRKNLKTTKNLQRITTKEETIVEENRKATDKKHILDWVVSGIALVAMIVLYFFWGCPIDLWATLLCLVVVVAGSILLHMQHKKLKELR